MNSEDLTTARGCAVTAVWGDLPAGVQHELFKSAVRLLDCQARLRPSR